MPNPMPPTDPTGRSFLCYRRSNAREAALLISAQHLHGIPTWQDVNDLENGPTVDYIETTLNDHTTANSLLLVTPDVATSDFIRNIEAPKIIERVHKNDDFFAVPIASGGLDHKSAPLALGPNSASIIKSWHWTTDAGASMDEAFATNCAITVMRRRLKLIHRQLPAEEPLKLVLSTRANERYKPGRALILHWAQFFNGREVSSNLWLNSLKPALEQISSAILELEPERHIEASGLPSLVATVLLGIAFLEPRRIPIAWSQYLGPQGEQSWKLEHDLCPVNIHEQLHHRDVSSSDLAVLIAIARPMAEVRRGFIASETHLPPFRAVLEIGKNDGEKYFLANSTEASSAARRIVAAIQQAKVKLYPSIQTIHLFLAVPAGLAMMIGQLLNGFPSIQLYEYLAEETANPYRPACKVIPST